MLSAMRVPRTSLRGLSEGSKPGSCPKGSYKGIAESLKNTTLCWFRSTYCIVLPWITLRCVGLDWIVWQCIGSCWIELVRIEFDWVGWRCIVLHRIALIYNAWYCTALHCIALQCIALHCSASRVNVVAHTTIKIVLYLSAQCNILSCRIVELITSLIGILQLTRLPYIYEWVWGVPDASLPW